MGLFTRARTTAEAPAFSLPARPPRSLRLPQSRLALDSLAVPAVPHAAGSALRRRPEAVAPRTAPAVRPVAAEVPKVEEPRVPAVAAPALTAVIPPEILARAEGALILPAPAPVWTPDASVTTAPVLTLPDDPVVAEAPAPVPADVEPPADTEARRQEETSPEPEPAREETPRPEPRPARTVDVFNGSVPARASDASFLDRESPPVAQPLSAEKIAAADTPWDRASAFAAACLLFGNAWQRVDPKAAGRPAHLAPKPDEAPTT